MGVFLSLFMILHYIFLPFLLILIQKLHNSTKYIILLLHNLHTLNPPNIPLRSPATNMSMGMWIPVYKLINFVLYLSLDLS